jgi:hypothetical protein
LLAFNSIGTAALYGIGPLSTVSFRDCNTNGTFTAADFTVWRDMFGREPRGRRVRHGSIDNGTNFKTRWRGGRSSC